MPDNPEGQNLDPDAGQAQLQERADKVEAVGFFASNGADFGPDSESTAEELADAQKEANKQFTMPPDGLAAEKPVPPHSAEAASSDESEDGGEGGKPAESASRAEWDAYAESQGDDPSQFSSKQELIDYYK